MDSFQLAYWHWFLAAGVLLVADVLLPRFMLLWIGMAALVVAVATLVLPSLSLAYQLVLWALAAAVLTILWSRYFKGSLRKKSEADMARQTAIGEAGIVEQAPADNGRGRVRFPAPILGEETWLFTCEQDVEEGDRVFIKAFEGDGLVMIKL